MKIIESISQFKYVMMFALSVTLLNYAGKANAQSDCKCEIISLEQCDSLAGLSDTNVYKKSIQQLQKSKNVFCKVLEKELQINYQISKRQSDFLHLVKDQEALIKATDCKDKLLGISYRNYTVFYKRQQDFENLSKYAFEHLAHAEKIKSKREEVNALRNIVHLFTMQDEDDKLPKYIARARRVIYSMSEDKRSAESLIWLAMNYETLYTQTENKKYLDTVYSNTMRAMQVANRFNDVLNLAQAHRVLEAYNYHKGNLEQAIVHIDSAIMYLRSVNMKLNLSSLFLAKSWDYVDMGNKIAAMQWIDSAKDYEQRYDKGSMGESNTFLSAAQIYEELGEIPFAYRDFKKYEHLKDSLFSASRSETINELEQKYFKAKNEKTIKELSQQQKIYWLLIAAALLGLITLVFFIRQQSLKNKQKVMETEQRLNRARMNPHFFFNALSSIQSYALQGHDGLSIATNISKFSHIMRETLESTYKEYVTVEQEMEFLVEYLELQKMRFPNKYEYEINCSEKIDGDTALIPSMILQPFVENSIEHGFVGLDKMGVLIIDFDNEGDNILITVSDNGKGLLNEVKDDNEHISRAGQIIKDRIYLLNLKLKTAATFSIENKKNESGVLVKIKLPYLEKNGNQNLA